MGEGVLWFGLGDMEGEQLGTQLEMGGRSYFLRKHPGALPGSLYPGALCSSSFQSVISVHH